MLKADNKGSQESKMIRSRLPVFILSLIATKHLVWAVLLLWSSNAAGSTSLHEVNQDLYVGRYGTVLVLVVASVLAFSLLWKSRQASIWTALAITPQAIIVITAGLGAIKAVLNSHYADLEPRPWEFIAADQITPILILIWHQAAIINFHFRGKV